MLIATTAIGGGILAVLAAGVLSACDTSHARPAARQQRTSVLQPTAMAGSNDDAEWVRPAGDYSSTRYSALSDINKTNVAQLKVAWTFATGLTRGHEAAPLVINATMFVVTPYPNVLYAFDLKRPGGPVKWKYEPKPAAASQGVACCDHVNRGASIWPLWRVGYGISVVYVFTTAMHTGLLGVLITLATGRWYAFITAARRHGVSPHSMTSRSPDS